jgi:arylsulfatase A-like enzyme
VLMLIGTLLPQVYVSLTTPRLADASPSPVARADMPDILLVVLDTVRAENMSAYGYGRPTTPHFDALARESTLFLDATAPATWSLPSHASLFTGRFPSSHGAHYEHPLLGQRWATLAEVLGEAGYTTHCFTANVFLNDTLGLTRGFQHKDEAWRSQVGGASGGFIPRLLDRLGLGASDKGGARVVSHFEEWLETRAESAPPAFVFVNFLEAHFPYHQLPKPFLTRFSDAPISELRSVSEALMGAQFGGPQPDLDLIRGAATDLYDAGVLYTDHLMGQLVEILRESDLLDETIIVVLSDHGELLGEHGAFGHGSSLLEPALRVPLLVHAPDRVPAGVRVARSVSTVGAAATILDLAGVEAPASFQVRSLIPVIEGAPGGGPSIAERFAERGFGPKGVTADPLMAMDRRFRTYRSGDFKLLESSRGGVMLFDLKDDPGETVDRARKRPRARKQAEAELLDWRSLLGLPDIHGPLRRRPVPRLDPEAHERLRELGYVE